MLVVLNYPYLLVSLTILLKASDAGLSAPEPDPQFITGGTETTNCQFPSVVSVLEDDDTPVWCSGTLVHPNVVSIAAHCVTPARPIVGIGFGEVGEGETGAPQRVVDIEDCVAHPGYLSEGHPDIGFCTLAEPVDDVPIIPILAGCDVELLEEGTEITIVGFGAVYGEYAGDGFNTHGTGPKRHTLQTIYDVDLADDEVHLVGSSGAQSACFGDSGGPAFIELSDGSWRVFGAASELYNPSGFPPPGTPGNICGVGVTYGVLSTRLDWLEAQTGYDLTPCHDPDGHWDPSSDCGDFPTDPLAGDGDWATGCVGGPIGGGQPLCGEIGGGSSSGGDPSGSTSTTTDSGMADTEDPPEGTSDSGNSGDTGGGGTLGNSTSGPASTSSPTSDGISRTTGSDGESSGQAELDDDASSQGCACAASSDGYQDGWTDSWGALFILGLGLGLRRFN